MKEKKAKENQALTEGILFAGYVCDGYLLIAALMNPMKSGLGLSTVLVYSG